MARGRAGVIVDIGDVPVLLHASDDARADALLGHLGGARRHAGPPRVTLRFELTGPPIPSRPPQLTIEDVRLWRDGTCLHLQHASGATAVVTGTDAWVGGGGGDPAGPFHRLLLLVLAQLLAHHERYVLHAAAVVPRRDAVVVLGDTGQGKSTAAVAGLRSGWPVLGDDMVVVRAGADGPEVAGIARPGALPADVAGDLGGPALPDDPRGRRGLPASAFTAGWFPVAAVATVAHGSSTPGALRALDPRSTLYALMSAFPGASTPHFLRRFFPLAAALSRGPSCELLLAAEPGVRVADTARLLTSAVS